MFVGIKFLEDFSRGRRIVASYTTDEERKRFKIFAEETLK